MQLKEIPPLKLEISIIQDVDQITDEPLLSFAIEKVLNAESDTINRNFKLIKPANSLQTTAKLGVVAPPIADSRMEIKVATEPRKRTWRNMFGMWGGRKTRRRR